MMRRSHLDAELSPSLILNMLRHICIQHRDPAPMWHMCGALGRICATYAALEPACIMPGVSLPRQISDFQ